MQAIILFSDAHCARQLVAGVPAAARVLREAALAGASHCIVSAPGDWCPGKLLRAEAARLAPGLRISYCSEADALAQPDPDALAVSGEQLPAVSALRRAAAGDRAIAGARLVHLGCAGALRHGGGRRALAAASRRLLLATAKPGDGIVSRHINRPISQSISGLLLRVPAIRPIHATWFTAVIALAMAHALVQGTDVGLVIGALLFQAASIFDGVDGEISRATFRTSPEGARFDSLGDAITNIACIVGVALNLHLQGDSSAALAGLAGVSIMAFGLAVIAQAGPQEQGGLSFNAVKDHFAARPSPVMQWLTWLTMRDFYALLGAVLVIAGLAAPAMYLLAMVATGWLMVVVAVLPRQSTGSRANHLLFADDLSMRRVSHRAPHRSEGIEP